VAGDLLQAGERVEAGAADDADRPAAHARSFTG
jgi:hypothetical protein